MISGAGYGIHTNCIIKVLIEMRLELALYADTLITTACSMYWANDDISFFAIVRKRIIRENKTN